MINQVVIVGRITKDIDLRFTPAGVAVANYTVAATRPFSNANGEKETDFISCVSFKKQAENMANFLRKGSLIGVTGRLQTRNYEGQDGKRVYITEVLAESVQFLEPRGSNNNDNTQSNTNTAPPTQNGNTGQNNGYNMTDEELNDGLPF